MVTLALFVSGQPRSRGAGSGKGGSWLPPQTGLQICQRRGEDGGESLVRRQLRALGGGLGQGRHMRSGLEQSSCGGRGRGRGMQKDTLLLLCWISSTCGPGGGGGLRAGERGNTRGYRKMLAPEASPRGRLPAAVPAVEGDDPVLIRRPFDAWGRKVWFLR